MEFEGRWMSVKHKLYTTKYAIIIMRMRSGDPVRVGYARQAPGPAFVLPRVVGCSYYLAAPLTTVFPPHWGGSLPGTAAARFNMVTDYNIHYVPQTCQAPPSTDGDCVRMYVIEVRKLEPFSSVLCTG